MSSTRLSSANKPLLQGLPPILPDGKIKALILGSFPSVASLKAQQYYAHPQNHFWRVLEHCRIIESATADYPVRVAQVQAAGLAIWDLYKEVTRQGSGDDQIRNEAPNDISTLMQETRPLPNPPKREKTTRVETPLRTPRCADDSAAKYQPKTVALEYSKDTRVSDGRMGQRDPGCCSAEGALCLEATRE